MSDFCLRVGVLYFSACLEKLSFLSWGKDKNMAGKNSVDELSWVVLAISALLILGISL